MYEHDYSFPHDFDPHNVTEIDVRNMTRSYYDFVNWCEANTESAYHIEKHYSKYGINISFVSEKDHMKFIDFAADCYWIFLHN